MSGKIIIVVAVAGVIAITGWRVFNTTSSTAALRPDDNAVVAAGKIVYAKNCASCHGAKLEGQPNWQSRLADGLYPAPPHDETGHTWHHGDDLLIAITRSGSAVVMGDVGNSNMPGFENRLGEAEIIAVLSFIKSTWPAEIRQANNRINQARDRAM